MYVLANLIAIPSIALSCKFIGKFNWTGAVIMFALIVIISLIAMSLFLKLRPIKK